MSSIALSTPESKPSRAVRILLFRNRQILFGGAIALGLILMAIGAPLFAPMDPAKQELVNTLKPVGTSGHLLGTDELGRDVLSRLIWGARASLLVGLLTALMSICIGVPLGLAAGYFGGRVDTLVARIVDAVLGVPSILLALGLAAIFGPSLLIIVISLGVVWWASYARIVRAEAMALKSMAFVEAGQSLGCSNSRIIFRYMLPNVLPIVLALSASTVAAGILVEASLSFLGVGTQPPTPSWGAMLSTGRNYIHSAGYLATIPGLAIVLAILSLNILADGLRDLSDPTLRK
ncbi:MAG TPA: ABC transporter permease [Thermomicrobiales bacterium]|nr:ABC transporter permease [Thermomicrobiales bacterium]